jgi:hypothetical protein
MIPVTITTIESVICTDSLQWSGASNGRVDSVGPTSGTKTQVIQVPQGQLTSVFLYEWPTNPKAMQNDKMIAVQASSGPVTSFIEMGSGVTTDLYWWGQLDVVGGGGITLVY